MPANNRLRIGVTGHRVPPKLPDASEPPLRALIDRIFAEIVGHDVVVVSSLAEGADRIVAYAGLAAGFELEAVLPFGRTEYERDFETKESRAEFEQLLANASDIIELDGPAKERPRAYEAAGLFMLANVDVLIAIWDGERAAGIGGTAQMVGRAAAEGILVLWIQPLHPNTIHISSTGDPVASPADATTNPKGAFRLADVSDATRAINEIPGRPA
jgi:hypothetical protein